MPKHIPNVCKEFTDYTSMHGISRMGSGQFIIQKIGWLMLFCTSIGYSLFQTYTLYQQYRSEPTNTIMKNKYGELAFPKVSFCNLNPMKFSKMLEHEELFKIINETAALTGVNILDFGTNVEKYSNKCPSTVPLGIESTSNAKNMFYQRMGQLPSLVEESAKKTEFMISCEYQGKLCFMKDVTPYRDEFYGMCYRFIPSEEEKVASPGPQGGLTLTLNVEQTEYIPFITGSAGIVMDISRNEKDSENKTPSMRRTGILLSPNMETNIALNSVEHTRIPGSEKKCAVGIDSDVAGCIEYCVGITGAEVSGCAHEYTYVGEQPLCTTLTEVEINKIQNLDISEMCSRCNIPCHELDTASYMKVHIFFSTLSTTVIQEEKAYTFENFLSDICGQLGLWAGISVLSLVEVLELLVLIVVGFFARRNKTASKSESVEDLKKISA